MPKKYQSYFEILLILLAGLVTQTWFEGRLLVSIDTFLPIKLNTFLNEYFYVWSWKTAFGFADVNKLPFLAPLGVLLKIYALSHLPFSPLIFQRILTYLLFTGGGLSAYHLFRVCFPQSHSLPRLLAALLYMFNFYVMFLLSALPYPLLFSYAFFPFVFSLYIKWLEGERTLFKPVALALVWFTLLTPSYMTPPYLVLHFFILMLYSSFWVLSSDTRKRRVKKVVWFNGLFLVFWLCLNSFWLLPTTLNLKEQLTTPVMQEMTPKDLFALNSVPVWESFRLRGYFGFADSYKGSPFYPWFKLYNRPFFEILSFITPITAFLWLLVAKKRHRRALFFTFFTLLFITLAKGANPPFGAVNRFIFSFPHVTTMFRTVYQRFTGYIGLGMAILAGYTLDCLFKTKFFKSIKARLALFVPLVVLVCGVYVLPIWNGSLFSRQGLFPSMRVKIPDYYFQVAKWLDGQESHFNTLLLPFNRHGLAMNYWSGGNDGYDGIEPLTLLSKSRFAYGEFGRGLGRDLAAALVSDLAGKGKLLSPFNFKYVLVKNDTNWKYIRGNQSWIGNDREEIQASLSAAEGLKKIKSFGLLDIYQLDDDYLLPHFYIPERSFYVDGGFEAFSGATDSEIFRARPGVYPAGREGAGGLKTDMLGKMDGILVSGKGPLGSLASEAEWWEWWSWPEASVNPGSWKYPLVRLKEWWMEEREENVFDRADTLLWYGVKRVEEVKRWGGGNFESLVSRYEKKMYAAIEILEAVPEKEQDERFWELVEKFLVYIERAEREVTDSGVLSVEYLEKFKGVNNRLQARVDEVVGPRCSKSELCYRVEIPEDGNYEVLAGGEDVKVLNVEEMGIRQERPEPALDQSRKNWVSFGEVPFGTGTHVLKFEVPESKNLLPEKNLTDGPTFYERISEWEYKKKYRISFDYEIDEGVRLLVKLVQKGGGANGAVSLRFVGEVGGGGAGKAGWRHFEKVVEARYGVEEVALYVHTDAGEDLEVAKFRNVEVRRTLEPTVILKKIRTVERTKEPVPKITFARVSPTKYKVKVEGAKEPYTLVFNEGFHKGWKVYLNTNASGDYGEINEGTRRNTFWDRETLETWGKRSMDADHLLINWYANSWYIEPDDVGGAKDYELIVEFWPQRLLYAGLFVSLTALLGSLGYLSYRWFLRGRFK